MTLDYQQVAAELLREHESVADIGEYCETQQVADGSSFDVSFECLKPGYSGWRWVVTFSQPDKRKTALVSEVNLIAGPNALLAPAWVPWAERLAEFRKQLKLEGKAETDDEADALIADMAGAELVDLSSSDHDVANETEQNSHGSSGNPPAKVRVRQRRIKNNQDQQGDAPDADANQDDTVSSDA